MKNLRHFREQAGLTQGGLAKLVHKSDRAISAYERGARNAPLSVALEIAKALHVDAGVLFTKDEVDVTSEEQLAWLEETVFRDVSLEPKRKKKIQRLLEAIKEEIREEKEDE